jgi:hypothetical protein
MGRLIALAGALFAYFCVATVLAVALGLGYALTTGALGEKQLEQMLALLHGVDLVPADAARKAADGAARVEQPSLEAIAEARAVKSRDLELREKILQDAVSELKKLQLALEAEKDRFEKFRISFHAQLNDEAKAAQLQGLREFQSLVENMKPKQAKEQLLLKHKAGSLDLVVDVLRGMEEAKRAKIIAEFKSAEESQVLSEVLEKIRVSPKLPLIEDTRRSLDPSIPPPSDAPTDARAKP